jgi:hypothetical protein
MPCCARLYPEAMLMLKRLIEINKKVSDGFYRVQWIFYTAAGSSVVVYILSLIHLAWLGIAAPVILTSVFYILGKAHEESA